MPLACISASSEEEINAVRGIGDEFALKLRYHDDEAASAQSAPGGPAQEMFQWIEDARVAAIGSLRMEGVAQNLDASLEVQCQQAAFDTITVETEAPLSVAVGLLVRQHLTGRPLPPSAENVVQFWREYVEQNAGDDIAQLQEHLLDQKKFARCAARIIADLGLAVELDEPPDPDENPEDVETIDENDESESDFSPEDVVLDEDAAMDENAEGESAMMEMDADMDMDELGAEADPDEAPDQLPDDAGRIRVRRQLPRLHRSVRRDRARGGALRAR